MMITKKNPLLGDPGLADCVRLSPRQMVGAIRQLVGEARAVTIQVTKPGIPDTWDGFVVPLEDVHDRLARAWGRIQHLHAVADTPKLRQVVVVSQRILTIYNAYALQHQRLYQKYLRLRKSSAFRRLTAPQQRAVDLDLRDFSRAGAHLPIVKRRRLRTLRADLSRSGIVFSHRLLDATEHGVVTTERTDDLVGIPATIIAAAKLRARQLHLRGWTFTIHNPEYGTTMRNAANRKLRQRLYHASVNRASELGPARMDTTPIMHRILVARQSVAQLLGYRDHATKVLVDNMARTPRRAVRFSVGITRSAYARARRERQMLERYARIRLGLSRLEAWDVDYVTEQVRGQRFGFSRDDLRPYFLLPAVLDALEVTVAKVYGINLRRKKHYRAYRRDLIVYECYDHDSAYRGLIIFDPFARTNKHAGAWMNEDTSRRIVRGHRQMPVAHCVCNFPPPIAGHPSGLTHDDVHTLFHEFGHVMHLIASDVDVPRVGGISGVEHDAVELPSQWFERFAWEPAVIRLIGKFSRRPLPPLLFRKLLSSRNFISGIRILRQSQFTLFDLLLHQQRRFYAETPIKLWRMVRRRWGVWPNMPYDRFPNSFSHIFDGGYSAGYYGYLWAEVLAADAFQQLHGHPATWPRIGRKFRREILAYGGSRPAAESFRAYRGRDPIQGPLLRGYGLNWS